MQAHLITPANNPIDFPEKADNQVVEHNEIQIIQRTAKIIYLSKHQSKQMIVAKELSEREAQIKKIRYSNHFNWLLQFKNWLSNIFKF